jgi:hypothetical protein
MGWIGNEFKSLKNTKMDTHPTKQSQKMYQEMFSGQNTSTHIYINTQREKRERGAVKVIPSRVKLSQRK